MERNTSSFSLIVGQFGDRLKPKKAVDTAFGTETTNKPDIVALKRQWIVWLSSWNLKNLAKLLSQPNLWHNYWYKVVIQMRSTYVT